jgi:hypothetical protein
VRHLLVVCMLVGCHTQADERQNASSDDASVDVVDAAAPTTSAVWTNHNDNGRTGAKLDETQLTPESVGSDRFGLLFRRPVEGQIYAQPLWVPSIEIGGRSRNVVYVATQHDMLYAFDADDEAASTPLWSRSLGTPAPVSEVSDESPVFCTRFLNPEVGITGTPVIDVARGVLYVVAFVRRGAGDFVHRLHAVDLRTGADRVAAVDIEATAPGAGYQGQPLCYDPTRPDAWDAPCNDSVSGKLTLVPKKHLQRPGLLLAGDAIFVGFASYCDLDPYHGWLLAYDGGTLEKRATYVTTPDGIRGGIWQSGQAPTADESGDVYLESGNGTFSSTAPPKNVGDTFVRLRLDGSTLSVVDWFTPWNASALDEGFNDLDLGSTGVLLVPGADRLIGGSKEGKLYVIDRRSMGHYDPKSDDHIVQWLQATAPPASPGEWNNLHGSPVHFRGDDGEWIYVWGENDVLRAFAFDRVAGRLSTTPTQGPTMAPKGMPGGMLAISANGTRDGVLWASMPRMGDASVATVDGVLRAYDARDVRHELWMATFSDALAVYGLR